MSDKSFTFFEIHLHDGIQVTNQAPFLGADEDVEALPETTGDEEPSEATDVDVGDAGEEESSGGLGVGKLLLALVVVAALAIAAWKFTGDDDDLEELEDLEEVRTEP